MRKIWFVVLTLVLMIASAGFTLAQDAGEEAAGLAAVESPPAAEPVGDEIAAEDSLGEVAGAAAEAISTPRGLPLGGLLLPQPTEREVIDVPNDAGGTLGALWTWHGATTPETKVAFEVHVARSVIADYELTVEEKTTLDAALAKLREALAPILVERAAAAAAAGEAQEALQVAVANKRPEANELRRDYWKKQKALDALQTRRDKLWDRFTSRAGPLFERWQTYRYLAASLNHSEWVASDAVDLKGEAFEDKTEFPEHFGHDPSDPNKLFTQISEIRPLHPGFFDGTYVPNQRDEYDYEAPSTVSIPLESGTLYNLRMVVADNLPEKYKLDAGGVFTLHQGLVETARSSVFDFGGATPLINYFDASVLNNLVLAVLFAALILSAIMIARRNPNMFIRRIRGLEAVDEAIGRATEMGKPVLYLCGLDSLATLSTLAAVNILGRVSRRIADYDSDLVVPCRDPVVLTVAQEVVREGYIDAGRPDAFREDKIFFVTDDQFSYTATTCAIMIRERPAANFFMGYYYAESLLLAETGASTGAIQIAGTDALHQLPFFITTCDYTLIGEELYAASAYLSREPMLLGSLKGQDVGKAVIMLLIILQTLLFIVSASIGSEGWDWLRVLVEPL